MLVTGSLGVEIQSNNISFYFFFADVNTFGKVTHEYNENGIIINPNEFRIHILRKQLCRYQNKFKILLIQSMKWSVTNEYRVKIFYDFKFQPTQKNQSTIS